MKTNMYVFVAFLATLFFASCSKETSEPEPQSGEKVTVKLEVKGTPAVNGRATGTLPTDNNDGEKKIQRIVVAIFNTTKTTNTIAEFTSVEDIKINCTAGKGCTGLAVANAPAGYFAGVANIEAFLAKALNLDATLNGTDGTSGQFSTCLPMSGEIKMGTETTFDLAAGSTPSLTVNLSRLVARISINSMKTDFSKSVMYPKATFTLTRVFLRDALGTSNPGVGDYTTTVPATLSWLHDATKLTTAKIDTDLDKAWLKNDVSNVLITKEGVTTAYWFYAFANENAEHRTALVLQGQFDPDGPTNNGANPPTGTTAPTTVYYPIVVNKSQAGTIIKNGSTTTSDTRPGTIARNSTYNITVVIKNIGIPSPGGTIDPADLTLEVTVAGWALNIEQSVEFN